ncbi:MAG: hypothetical protein JWR59_489 [Brevundimonas sp.]|nr:hypothetical protein [Brevundimonas sp.]
MPLYEFRLELQGAAEPACEQVQAIDIDEARSLAELRLLLTHGMERVTVSHFGAEILQLERDARPRWNSSSCPSHGPSGHAEPEAPQGLNSV